MKQVNTFSEYMNDEERVSPAEREKINFGTCRAQRSKTARDREA